MHPNARLLRDFYQALAAGDHLTMARAYHPQAHFTDPVFDLQGERIAAMWWMLCTRGSDLTVEFRDVEADDLHGRGHWDARYTFSQTGRPVLNRIDASFEFHDGLIIRHIDRFDFWRWSRQALGPAGLALGWSGALRNKVKLVAARSLDKFIADQVA